MVNCFSMVIVYIYRLLDVIAKSRGLKEFIDILNDLETFKCHSAMKEWRYLNGDIDRVMVKDIRTLVEMLCDYAHYDDSMRNAIVMHLVWDRTAYESKFILPAWANRVGRNYDLSSYTTDFNTEMLCRCYIIAKDHMPDPDKSGEENKAAYQKYLSDCGLYPFVE